MRFKFMLSLPLLISTQTVVAAPSKHTELIIKPLTCMVKKQGELCSMKVKVKWKSEDDENFFCLYQNESRLKCWKDLSQAEDTLTITLTQDIEFLLKNKKLDVLARQKVQVQTATSRIYRRKLKSDWSVF